MRTLDYFWRVSGEEFLGFGSWYVLLLLHLLASTVSAQVVFPFFGAFL